MKTPELFFLPADATGQRLCAYHAPAGPARALLLYVHPFAEELNKSRRMAAWASRALAQAGCAVLQIDLHGCGDSSGDFADARWDRWRADLQAAKAWLQSRHGDALPLWLWSLRAGALLAAMDWGQPVNHLFWQPMTSGKACMQQFLRLRVAAEMATGHSKGLMEQLRSDLVAGRPVDVAGYRLAPDLHAAMDTARLAPAGPAARVVWLEVSTQAPMAFSPVSEQTQQAWRDAGWDVTPRLVAGPSFWSTTEIEDAPALIDATLEALA